MRKSPAKVYVLPSHAISSHLTTLVERWNLGKARQSVSDKRYLKYFVKKSSKHWSLRDFDCWALNYVKNCQQGATHRIFYRYLNGILLDEKSSRRKIKAYWYKEGRFEKCKQIVENAGSVKEYQ
ncbi:hypothetical protein RclHR1_14280006 [Rhizophagus clarus]|uniref:Uncharacterized protein n=1 Tax=Rhizophagus clarus TaxID=94130 RepID=A0A2Z6QDX9_9GLOM|nr:hypothetical protein RclHR1_14280006 [Rhizophagus clarus]